MAMKCRDIARAVDGIACLHVRHRGQKVLMVLMDELVERLHGRRKLARRLQPTSITLFLEATSRLKRELPESLIKVISDALLHPSQGSQGDSHQRQGSSKRKESSAPGVLEAMKCGELAKLAWSTCGASWRGAAALVAAGLLSIGEALYLLHALSRRAPRRSGLCLPAGPRDGPAPEAGLALVGSCTACTTDVVVAFLCVCIGRVACLAVSDAAAAALGLESSKTLQKVPRQLEICAAPGQGNPCRAGQNVAACETSPRSGLNDVKRRREAGDTTHLDAVFLLYSLARGKNAGARPLRRCHQPRGALTHLQSHLALPARVVAPLLQSFAWQPALLTEDWAKRSPASC